MQATTRINRSDIVGGRKLLAALAIAAAVALALGFQFGHVTAPVKQSVPTVKALTLPATGDPDRAAGQGAQLGGGRHPDHGALP